MNSTIIDTFCEYFKISKEEFFNFSNDEKNLKIIACKIKHLGDFTSSIFIVIFNKFKKNFEEFFFNSVKFYSSMLEKAIEYKNTLENENDFELILSEKTGHLNFKFLNSDLLNKYLSIHTNKNKIIKTCKFFLF